ncbi:DNA repair protein RadA [Candidatus Marinamargulisbacteria bacterium SCGC AAA071-K20]|nr:DNA repair protein RadA [Candidatus Marinamargulisbacteria bacterium SCGC AAA071-K20]
MAKLETIFECQECGSSHPRWQGQCTQCQAWNSLVEMTQEKLKKSSTFNPTKKSKATPLAQVEISEHHSIKTDISELDHVLGNGFVKGSVTLIGGEPGIGKSTLSLQLAIQLAKTGQKVLYITAEESETQILLRSKRLGTVPPSLLVLADTNMLNCLEQCNSLNADVVILDSIQTVSHPDLSATSGSVSQVKYCAAQLIAWTKSSNAISILIGHITKDGMIAGPKILEHMVDVILYVEGERNQRYRLLRSYKNRYFHTDEIGIFQMEECGLVPVDQASELFIEASSLKNPGTAVSAIIEGSRAFLVEVQALVVETGYGMAKRNFLGVNANRANLVIAGIEKILGKKLFSKDMFLNIIGGLKVDEPACDLAILMAIISSNEDLRFKRRVAFIGEIGLSGEIRSVPLIAKRLNECEKMGFEACFIPKTNAKNCPELKQLSVIPVSDLRDLMASVVKEFQSEHLVQT